MAKRHNPGGCHCCGYVPPCNGFICVNLKDSCGVVGTDHGIPGVHVTVKDGGGATVGTCTTATNGQCCVPISASGTYTITHDDPCALPTSTTISALCNQDNFVTFRRSTAPPSSVTDPLGNVIPLSPIGGGKSQGCLAYSFCGPPPTYYGTGGPGDPFCPGYTPDYRKADCTALGPYDCISIPIQYTATRCAWTLDLFGLTLPGHVEFYALVDGHCSYFATPPTLPGCPARPSNSQPGSPIVGPGSTGSDCPYVGQSCSTIAPTPAQVDSWCAGAIPFPPSLWLLGPIFGASGCWTFAP